MLAAAFVIRKSESEQDDSQFIRLTDYLNTGEKIKEYFQSKNRYVMKQSSFYSVPGTRLYTGLLKMQFRHFKRGLLCLSFLRQGLECRQGTMHCLYVIGMKLISQNFYDKAKTSSDAIASGAKWFPYNKGGNFRKMVWHE